MSNITKQERKALREKAELEGPAERKEREHLEAEFDRLFVICGQTLVGYTLGYPRPWTKKYRDLLRKTVEAKDKSVWDNYLTETYPHWPHDGTIE